MVKLRVHDAEKNTKKIEYNFSPFSHQKKIPYSVNGARIEKLIGVIFHFSFFAPTRFPDFTLCTHTPRFLVLGY